MVAMKHRYCLSLVLAIGCASCSSERADDLGNGSAGGGGSAGAAGTVGVGGGGTAGAGGGAGSGASSGAGGDAGASGSGGSAGSGGSGGSPPGGGKLTWSGDFDNHDFSNFHSSTDPKKIFFWLVSDYGRPPQYGGQVNGHSGNGDLLDLVSSPTRGGKYAARFTVKNSANGSEPADCDPALDCKTRRTGLQMTTTLLKYYNAMPYGAERWLSFSIYLPTDFDPSGSGFGPSIWGSKGSLQQWPGWAGLFIRPEGWVFAHRYFSKAMHDVGVNPNQEWWLTTEYSATYPSSSSWAQGLVDYPNAAASKAALGNLNKGGWTDFVLHFRTDVDDFKNNTGFLDVYMRAGSQPWVHVLDIDPLKGVAKESSWVTSKPERVYDRGIGQYGPGGYTTQIGLYMAKGRVWNDKHDMTMYVDNYKIGDENMLFTQMSHDGSSP